MKSLSWQVSAPGRAPTLVEREVPRPPAGEVVVAVAGCGLCHTDLSYFEGGVQPRAGWPLVLGHEIAGRVVATGDETGEWLNESVVVPAVIPCGACGACLSGRGNTCPRQVMPGNDRDGGFSTHVTVPARGLAPIEHLPPGHDLADFAVIADAVSTPLQAMHRAKVQAGDVVVVVGCGGVGAHAVQLAAARGGRVIGLDVDPARLELLSAVPGIEPIDVRGMEPRRARDAAREAAERLGGRRDGWKVFECSGAVAGQELAWALLGPAATLAVIGFTREAARLKLSNLMAFDADAFGSWGCLPELYPEAIDLACQGRIALRPFLRQVPFEQLPDCLLDPGGDPRRAVLLPP